MGEANSRDETVTRKINREITEINQFIENMSESDFLTDNKTQKAVIMTLINIGELSRQYTEEFIMSKTSIPWKEIQATRNVAAHRYDKLNMLTIWDTVTTKLSLLQKELSIM